MGSTRCPGLLGLLSEVPRGPPALPGDSSSVSRSHGVHQNPRATRARVRGPTGLTSSPRRLGLGPSARRTARSPGRLTLASEGLWCRPALLGDSCSVPRARRVDPLPRASGLGPKACRVNQRSRRTRSWLQWLAGSTTYLVGAGAVFQCLRCPTALPGVSGPCLRPAISTNCTGQLALRSDGPWGRPAFPADSGSGPKARRVDKLSQVTRALVPGPTVSTSCPGRLRPGSEVLRGRPALQGDSRSGSGPAG